MSVRRFENIPLVIASAAGVGFLFGISSAKLWSRNLSTSDEGEAQQQVVVGNSDSWWDIVRIRMASKFLNSYYSVFGMVDESSPKSLNVPSEPSEFKTTVKKHYIHTQEVINFFHYSYITTCFNLY
jgi:hypothetical protein